MAVTSKVTIDAEIETVGQYDRLERSHQQVEVSFVEDGRVRIGDMTVDYGDLLEAVERLIAVR